ncbi:MAG: serine hydroxymethyltransferase [Deltaproteobacteria bacterium]|nr:serine hydroxymethyltransferase [Deltaproteobacteria bacterium]
MSDMHSPLQEVDPAIHTLIAQEEKSQASVVRLIASDNYISKAVKEATASCFGNKYAEGYSYVWKDGERQRKNGRYYQGQDYINEVETIAIERCLKLFAPGKEDQYHANVQPLSGAPANFAVLNALLEPGERMLGLALESGGHLTHGHKVNVTAKFFSASQFKLGADDRLDYDSIRQIAREVRPKVMIVGTTAYPRAIDFAVVGDIAKEVGAFLVADVAHISGLVATGCHPHPFPHADVMTMTTHKVLRGPRGGIIVCKKELGEKIDRSVFPSLQGGPHMNNIAGIAVALKEALRPDYTAYARQVVANSKKLADRMLENGFSLVTGGTDNHMIVCDVTKGSSDIRVQGGTWMANKMEKAGLICNKNSVPGDVKPWVPSGIRVGTPAITTVGFKEAEMVMVGDWIKRVAMHGDDDSVLEAIRNEAAELMSRMSVPL